MAKKQKLVNFVFASGEKTTINILAGIKGLRDSKGKRPIDFFTDHRLTGDELNDIRNALAGGRSEDIPGSEKVRMMFWELENGK